MSSHWDSSEKSLPAGFQTELLTLWICDLDFRKQYPSLIRPEYFGDKDATDLTLPGIVALAWHAALKEYGPDIQVDKGKFLDIMRDFFSKHPHIKRKFTQSERLQHSMKMLLKTIFTTVVHDSQKPFIIARAVKFAKAVLTMKVLTKHLENGELKAGNLDNFLREMQEVNSIGSTLEDRSIDVLNCDVHELKDKYIESKVSTGYDVLNDCLDGGLGAGELGVILGPTSGHKSFVTNDMAVSAYEAGKKVDVITLEMTKEQYARRAIARLIHKDRNFLVTKPNKTKKLLKERREYLKQKYEALGKTEGTLNITAYDSQQFSLTDLDGYIQRRIAQGCKPDILFIDYADLMKPTRNRKDLRIELSETYRGLAALANKYEIPIWTPTQANRQGNTRETITKTDVAEDFGKMTIANVVVSLNQTQNEYEEKIIRLFIAKNRDSAARTTFGFQVNYETGRLVNGYSMDNGLYRSRSN